MYYKLRNTKFSKIISHVCALVLFLGCTNSVPSFNWVETLPKPWELSEDEFASYLPKFKEKYPDFHDRIKAINLWRVGTPYGIFKLGEEIDPDPDPILRVDTSDCTVHVLTTLAFAQSDDWADSRNNMINIHYKANENGKSIPTFKSRWHYTSDRILNHQQTVDITSLLVPEQYLETITIELNRKEDGSEFLDLGWSSVQNISFIPVKNVHHMNMEKLQEVCGVAFVKRSYFSSGIMIAHEGYLIDKERLIHASSVDGKTVNVPFLEYLSNNGNSRFDGVMIYKILPDNKS